MQQSITIYPENAKQFSLLETLLLSMNVRFSEKTDEQVVALEQWQKDILSQRLNSVADGKVKTKEETHLIFDQCFS